MSRKSFVLYTEWENTFNRLSNELAGELIKVIFDYVRTGEIPQIDNAVVDGVFSAFQPSIDRNISKYDAAIEQRKEAGKRSAEKRKRDATTVESRLRTSTVSDSVNDSVTREVITRKQQREFLRFIKEDKHFCKYYDGIYILFHTGLRVSEFVGLTINDIEFDKERIKVDHQLQRTRNMEYEILTPKTEKGERYVPMQKDVADCFRRIIQNRKHPKIEPMIDGYSGFLFLDKNDMPMVALHWEKYFQHIREKYNSIYKVQMPCITPHVCRHTFCSNMAKSGMNPKTLQYIMGHSDIGVTLNTYTHLQFEDALVEMKKVVG